MQIILLQISCILTKLHLKYIIPFWSCQYKFENIFAFCAIFSAQTGIFWWIPAHFCLDPLYLVVKQPEKAQALVPSPFFHFRPPGLR
jgi:hypothetical protein